MDNGTACLVVVRNERGVLGSIVHGILKCCNLIVNSAVTRKSVF